MRACSIIRTALVGIATITILTIQTGCEHALPTPPPPSQATLSIIQTSIFSPSCAFSGCHIPNSLGPMPMRNATESFNSLVNVNSIQRPTLKRVQPGNAANSYIIQKLDGASGIFGARMPLGVPLLSTDEINLIRQWIDEGALNN